MKLHCPDCRDKNPGNFLYRRLARSGWQQIAQYSEVRGYYLVSERIAKRCRIYCDVNGHERPIAREIYSLDGEYLRATDDYIMETIL